MILRFKHGMVLAEPSQAGETLTIGLAPFGGDGQMELLFRRERAIATITFSGADAAPRIAERLRELATLIENGGL